MATRKQKRSAKLTQLREGDYCEGRVMKKKSDWGLISEVPQQSSNRNILARERMKNPWKEMGETLKKSPSRKDGKEAERKAENIPRGEGKRVGTEASTINQSEWGFSYTFSAQNRGRTSPAKLPTGGNGTRMGPT